MRGLAFIGGEAPGKKALREIASAADLIVAADSGLTAAEEAGINPHMVLGDMDSLDDLRRLDKYSDAEVRRFPAEKDLTDTELAFNFLKERGCDEIWLAGGGGGRMDHLLAIRSLFEREESPARWFPGNEEIRCLKEGMALRVSLPCQSVVSVFPLGKGNWQAKSSGLKWPLDALLWEEGTFSVSNLAARSPLEIRSICGRFMVVMPWVEGNIRLEGGINGCGYY